MVGVCLLCLEGKKKMHCEKREQSIQSHLKFASRLKGYSLEHLKVFIDELLFEKPYRSAGYIRSILTTFKTRLNLSQTAVRAALKYLAGQSATLRLAYLAKAKKEPHLYNSLGEECTYEEILGKNHKEIFKKMDSVNTGVIKQEDAQRVLEYLDLPENTKRHELALLLHFIWSNGSRKNEVYQLNDSQKLQKLIDTKVTEVQGKTVANQQFLIDDKMHKYLLNYIAKYGQPLFVRTPRTHLNMYDKTLDELGVVAKHWIRNWRNIFSARCSKANMCQQILNHASPNMTRMYQEQVFKTDSSEKLSYLNKLNNI